jgi:hypothetical protein
MDDLNPCKTRQKLMILKDQIHLPHHHPKTKNIHYIRYIIGIFPLIIFVCGSFIVEEPMSIL